MSYIIKSTNPFIKVKLTEIGRQKLATGQLTFNKWAVGDSEIDYGYVNPNPPGVSEQILRPKDRQPNIKYYLTTATGEIKLNLTNNDLRVLGITVNNQADLRGFFAAGSPTSGWAIQTGSNYVKHVGTVDCSLLTGGNTIDLGTTNFSECDYVLFIVPNTTTGTLTSSLAQDPVPYLWFQIVSGQTVGSTVTLDRDLPDLSSLSCNGVDVEFIIYPGCGDPINTFYGSGCTSAYWNTGTLSFDASCDISIADVEVWNQNNVWCEDIIGTQPTQETHRDYGSIDFIGEKLYLGFPCDCSGTGSTLNCCDPTQSYDDTTQKGIGIIHYTNNTISNFYGEFFYVDASTNKLLILDIPTVMWDRRDFGGVSATGNLIGMRFVSDTTLKIVTNTNIEYYDLIEDSTYISSSNTPLVVGRVYPQLKIVVITDEELLAAMSFKSNRNWTLPKLNATLTNPASTGVLGPNQTMYLTYDIRPTSGYLQPSLPCQKYIKITNTNATAKDVYFTLENTGLLPYMREVEAGGYDGLGFYGDEFVVLAQIVTGTTSCRPDHTAWREIVWTDPDGGTLNPLEIEDQNPVINDFLIDTARYGSASFYDATILGMPLSGQTTIMGFGDERFFYGNLDTYIGARIFKTIFSLNVSRDQFIATTNPTYGASNNGILNISDIGIYDNFGNLVIIGKLSTPVELPAGTVANIEMTLDF